MRGLKVFGLTAMSHVSKLLVALLIMKVIATASGPAGLGFLGNYMSVLSIASALAGGGVLTGVIKYISELSSDSLRQRYFVGSALLYSLGFSLVIVVLGLLFIGPVTNYIFGDVRYLGFVVFFLCAQIFVALNNLSYGVLNGLQMNRRYAEIVIVGNFFSAFISCIIIFKFGVGGAIVAVTIPLLVPLLLVLYFYLDRVYLLKFDKYFFFQDAIKLSRFSLMLMVSAICFPVVEIYVRSSIVSTVGIDMSGIWQALIRLSSAYLSFYSVFLSFYLVPKVSATEDKETIYRLTCKVMLALSVLFGCMFLIVNTMKNQLVELVLSEDFLAVGNYLPLQMLGDYFRIMGWVIGFVVVAKASTKLYILGELFQGVAFMLFSSLLLDFLKSMDGVVWAYVITCFLYFIFSVLGFLFYVKKSIFLCRIAL